MPQTARHPDLRGQRVVVTGGASGIGLATAQRFAAEGSRVVILDWNQQHLDAALAANPGLAGGVQADVSKPAEVERAFAAVDRLIGGIDVLINNAGISIRKPFLEIDYDQWSHVLGVNLGGMFLCARAAIARMERQQSGVVLFTASTNGLDGHRYYTDYNAAKAGVILLMKTVAVEFAPWLRTNAICPGYVLTPMQQAEYTPEMLAAVNQKIPLRRHADPHEVAALFAFLASSEAAYITGQAVCIDGGETATRV